MKKTRIILICSILFVSVAVGLFIFFGARDTSFGWDIQQQSCVGRPRYITSLGFGPQGGYTTSDRFQSGIVLKYLSDGQIKSYSRPSWSSFGRLGAIVYDRLGNAYTVPVPFVDVLNVGTLTKGLVLKVDTDSGELMPFVRIPEPHDSGDFFHNPYDVLGLALQCSTNTIFVSTVMGSDETYERGSIYKVSSKGDVEKIIDGIDALSLATVTSNNKDYLLIGSARHPKIQVYDFGQGEVVDEIGFSNVVNSVNERAKKIVVEKPGEITLVTFPFKYNLRASTADLTKTYVMHNVAGSWELVENKK